MYKGTNLKEIQQKYQERMTDLFNEINEAYYW